MPSPSTRVLLRAMGKQVIVKSAFVAGVLSLAGMSTAHADFTLTILHNNDGESALLPNGDEGGIARFVQLVNDTKAASVNPIMLSSGDNFLAGKAFAASEANGTYYDAEAIKAIGYDAVILGNHDFDFGPDLLADFIGQVGSSTPYVSANLSIPDTSNLGAAGVAKSTTISVGGTTVGVVGATTPTLPTISSPGYVSVLDQAGTVKAVQKEIDQLIAGGVNKIVFVSHLQGLGSDLNLLPQLSGVDVAIAGGGDELLASPVGGSYSEVLLPSHQIDSDSSGLPDELVGPYPLSTSDSTADANGIVDIVNKDGDVVPVVTTNGQYSYLGKLVVNFDDSGNLLSIGENSNVIRNYGPDGVAEDPTVKSSIEDPIATFFAELDTTAVATTTHAIDGRRSSVRGKETNVGNLMTDAFVWSALENQDEFDLTLDNAVIGLQNGGGIRNDSILADGSVIALIDNSDLRQQLLDLDQSAGGNNNGLADEISAGDLFAIAPFSNNVSVVEGLTGEVLLAALENAVSGLPGLSGRFAQVSGIQFTYDPDQEAGQRIVDVFLAGLNGDEQIVDDGVLLDPSFLFDLITIDFLLGDTDGYDWDLDGLQAGVDEDTVDYKLIGLSYQQALSQYLIDGLGGQLQGGAYAFGGEGRIKAVPEPVGLSLLAFGVLMIRRRRMD